MKRLLFFGLVIALYLLHQDYWNWRAIEPLAFGFLPIGLFYHVCYTLAVTAVMWLLVKYAWPTRLEERVEAQGRAGDVASDARAAAPSRARADKGEVRK
jgi:hypothetical protein